LSKPVSTSKGSCLDVDTEGCGRLALNQIAL
jgi:hypothetical protein